MSKNTQRVVSQSPELEAVSFKRIASEPFEQLHFFFEWITVSAFRTETIFFERMTIFFELVVLDIFERTKILFERITLAVRTKEHFIRADNLSRSNG